MTTYIVRTKTKKNGEQETKFKTHVEAYIFMKKLESQKSVISASLVKHVEDETLMFWSRR